MLKFDDTTENIMMNLEKTQKEFWNLDRYCAQYLYMLIKMRNAKNVLEIGTSNGYSGLWILNALRETKGKLTTIEFWEKRQSVARKNFDTCGFNGVYEAKIGSAIVVLEDLAYEIERNKRIKYDFIFIDANKKEYIDYFKLVDKMIAPSGVILADNILSHEEKTKPYVDELNSRNDYVSLILEMGAGMMMSIKN